MWPWPSCDLAHDRNNTSVLANPLFSVSDYVCLQLYARGLHLTIVSIIDSLANCFIVLIVLSIM